MTEIPTVCESSSTWWVLCPRYKLA